MSKAFALGLVMSLSGYSGVSSAAKADDDHPEKRWMGAWQAYQSGDVESASEALASLVKEEPDFDLARLAYAEMSFAGFGGLLGDASLMDQLGLDGKLVTKAKQARNELHTEARRRLAYWKAASELDDGNAEEMWPGEVVQLADRYTQFLLVDGEHSRLEIWYNPRSAANATKKPVSNYFTSIAREGLDKRHQGDQRTPIGVYFTTARLNKPGLGDLYGAGAISLNYPNAWDRIQNRSGYGIWLHGVPYNTYNRESLATNGCVALPNADFEALNQAVGLSVTPVIVVSKREAPLPEHTLSALRTDFLVRLGSWQAAQNEGSSAALEAFYAKDLPENKRAAWSWRKEKSEKAVRQVSIFRYPQTEGTPVVLLTFEQFEVERPERVRSLRQYWQQENGEWQIQAEEVNAVLPVHWQGIPEGVDPVVHR